MKKKIFLGWFFFDKYKFIQIPFLRKIQIQIYFGVHRQYEYKFDNLDWYLKIQTQIWKNSTQNKLYAYKYKCYKIMQINIHMCHNIWFLLLHKKIQYFMILFHMYSTKFPEWLIQN